MRKRWFFFVKVGRGRYRARSQIYPPQDELVHKFVRDNIAPQADGIVFTSHRSFWISHLSPARTEIS